MGIMNLIHTFAERVKGSLTNPQKGFLEIELDAMARAGYDVGKNGKIFCQHPEPMPPARN